LRVYIDFQMPFRDGKRNGSNIKTLNGSNSKTHNDSKCQRFK
jgi:hypothetical protein